MRDTKLTAKSGKFKIIVCPSTDEEQDPRLKKAATYQQVKNVMKRGELSSMAEFSFDTETELDAFIKGYEAGVGWLGEGFFVTRHQSDVKRPAMPPFEHPVNLDDQQELEQFLSSHEPARGRLLANMLRFKGRSAVRAANGLMNYAQNKRAANLLRSSGKIQKAKDYEDICDRIYKEDIQPLIKCW